MNAQEPSLRFAVLSSPYHGQVGSGLLDGALEYLRENKIHVAPQDIYEAPGAFEMPLLAQELARSGDYQGVICLGCVIKGDTAHFEFISLGAAVGIQQASLNTGVPIAFGILTTYTEEQAFVRSRPGSGTENKGREAAAACLASAKLLSRIRTQ